MSSSTDRCKLLILDVNANEINFATLWTHFTAYGQVDWIRLFPAFSSALVSFVDPLTVDHLITTRKYLIGQHHVRLRRARFNPDNWHLDSHTLFVKSHALGVLTVDALRHCFADYHSQIKKIYLIHPNQALIFFTGFDCVDQILLKPNDTFLVEHNPLSLERLIEKPTKRSRWDQPPAPVASTPTLAERDPLIHKLISHIEHLSNRLRDQPERMRNEIHRLEAEVFILQNENATLKSKRKLSAQNSAEQHPIVLGDISNRLANKENNREPSASIEHSAKRQRCTYDRSCA